MADLDVEQLKAELVESGFRPQRFSDPGQQGAQGPVAVHTPISLLCCRCFRQAVGTSV